MPWPPYPRERAPDTHWIGGWLGPRDGMDMVKTRKSHCPFWKTKPGYPVHSMVTILTEQHQVIFSFINST